MEHLVLRLIQTRRGRMIVALLLVMIGFVFCLIAWPDVNDAQRLRASRAEVDAEVVETRTLRDQHFHLSYELRYRFRVPGSESWYTRQERGTARTDLWSTLPQAQWERARAAKTLPVVYVLEDPRVNRPVAAETASASDSMGGLILGVACLGGGAVWLAGMLVAVVVHGGHSSVVAPSTNAKPA